MQSRDIFPCDHRLISKNLNSNPNAAVLALGRMWYRHENSEIFIFECQNCTKVIPSCKVILIVLGRGLRPDMSKNFLIFYKGKSRWKWGGRRRRLLYIQISVNYHRIPFIRICPALRTVGYCTATSVRSPLKEWSVKCISGFLSFVPSASLSVCSAHGTVTAVST